MKTIIIFRGTFSTTSVSLIAKMLTFFKDIQYRVYILNIFKKKKENYFDRARKAESHSCDGCKANNDGRRRDRRWRRGTVYIICMWRMWCISWVFLIFLMQLTIHHSLLFVKTFDGCFSIDIAMQIVSNQVDIAIQSQYNTHDITP